jgi:putative ATP-binding cassette transporter
VVAVIHRFTEERLGLLWREWLTRRLATVYLKHSIYYRLNNRVEADGEIANPDQRIADDVRLFTATTLSFVLMLLNGTFTVVAFAGVLLTISPLLFGVAVVYAASGSLLTIALGRPLVGLNYCQFDKEADFRADLIHIRENAESVALLRREGRLSARLLRHLDDLTANFQRIIAVNRNLGFFTTGYNYLIQIIPALFVAPLFIRGEVEFGVITQSAIAFTQLLGAFSLIITQFQSISSFTAVLVRLDSLGQAIQKARSPSGSVIGLDESDSQLACEGLTLRAPTDEHILIKNLSVVVNAGGRLLVTGSNEAAQVALFKATAGIWSGGEGRIVRPKTDRIFFLPERPYSPPGTLRELLLRTGQERYIADEAIRAALRTLNLEPVLDRIGGLDVEHDWETTLSLGEQQLLAFARILIAAPRFALLDRPSTALDLSQVEQMLKILAERGIGYVCFNETDIPADYYDAVLELADDGRWQWRRIEAGEVGEGGR